MTSIHMFVNRIIAHVDLSVGVPSTQRCVALIEYLSILLIPVYFLMLCECVPVSTTIGNCLLSKFIIVIILEFGIIRCMMFIRIFLDYHLTHITIHSIEVWVGDVLADWFGALPCLVLGDRFIRCRVVILLG